jgi:DNA-damage-inducible protein J
LGGAAVYRCDSAKSLSLSDAVRVLLTRVAAEKALPFEGKAPNAAMVAAMQEARNGGLPSFHNVSDLNGKIELSHGRNSA